MSQGSISDRAVDSKMGYKVLRKLTEEEEDYPTNIANKLGSTYHSVNNYMKSLRELGIAVKSEKEGRKQKYRVNLDGLYSLWKELYKTDIENVPEDLRNYEIFEEMGEVISQKEEETQKLVKDYILFYLTSVEESTIKKMLQGDFYRAVSLLPHRTDRDTPDWIKKWAMELSVLYSFSQNSDSPEDFLLDAVRSYKEEELGMKTPRKVLSDKVDDQSVRAVALGVFEDIRPDLEELDEDEMLYSNKIETKIESLVEDERVIEALEVLIEEFRDAD